MFRNWRNKKRTQKKKITEKHQNNFNLIASFCLCLLFRTIEYWFFTFSLGHCKKTTHQQRVGCSSLSFFSFFSIFISWSGYKAKAKAKAMHSQKDHVCPVNIKCICVFVFVDSWMENIVYSNHISIVVYNMVNFKRLLGRSVARISEWSDNVWSLGKHHVQRIRRYYFTIKYVSADRQKKKLNST